MSAVKVQQALHVLTESWQRHPMLHLVEAVKDDEETPGLIQRIEQVEVVVWDAVLAGKNLAEQPIHRLFVDDLSERDADRRSPRSIVECLLRHCGGEMPSESRLAATVACDDGERRRIGRVYPLADCLFEIRVIGCMRRDIELCDAGAIKLARQVEQVAVNVEEVPLKLGVRECLEIRVLLDEFAAIRRDCPL